MINVNFQDENESESSLLFDSSDVFVEQQWQTSYFNDSFTCTMEGRATSSATARFSCGLLGYVDAANCTGARPSRTSFGKYCKSSVTGNPETKKKWGRFGCWCKRWGWWN
ncbi:hypothetical protein TraAM80_00914 [Trypanosoma rangeli]|uniref:Uncharacterized protein n=1 Tax=Trypanosoma rangeli TaxID=5698 RepID=A0A422P183_TRYRA|nr:uncharacterized protein TraAM80_00914 [Trypanosoma rangeli]RNF11468.1 hypothetical protein TraAM80_00914 [Trypanosoma rangeli]|eukprot:RNF11468.1 hypothetical protein TraAM80_00914 [Trypanosoma rangeli]